MVSRYFTVPLMLPGGFPPKPLGMDDEPPLFLAETFKRNKIPKFSIIFRPHVSWKLSSVQSQILPYLSSVRE